MQICGVFVLRKIRATRAACFSLKKKGFRGSAMAVFVVVINPGSLGLALVVGTRKYEPVSITNGKLVLPIWYAFIFGMNLSSIRM